MCPTNDDWIHLKKLFHSMLFYLRMQAERPKHDQHSHTQLWSFAPSVLKTLIFIGEYSIEYKLAANLMMRLRAFICVPLPMPKRHNTYWSINKQSIEPSQKTLINSSVTCQQPQWRNGLARWTSNSKVVGSTPIWGGRCYMFLNVFSFFLCATARRFKLQK